MMYPGLELCDHSVEAGARLMELKLCENCPNTFVRQQHSGIKYCGPCRGRALMPMNLDDYREQLADTDRSSKHSNKLPKYDDSLLPKESRARILPIGIKRRKRRDYGDWRQRLLIAFAIKPQMTGEEMQDIIGVPGTPTMAVLLARTMIERVGWAPRTRTTMGRPPGIYSLKSTLTQ